MMAGDLWILSSYFIHHGWAVPRDAPAGSTFIIAFAAIATRHCHTSPTRPPCRSCRHRGLKPPRHNRRHGPRRSCTV